MKSRLTENAWIGLLILFGALPAAAGGGDHDHDGTSLTANISAEGVWSVVRDFDWVLAKSVEPREIVISRHHSGEVEFTLSATRGAPKDVETREIKGEVCVNNVGREATEGLLIFTKIQVREGHGFEDVPGASQSIIPAQPVEPYRSQCFPFELQAKFRAGGQYRAVAEIKFDNGTDDQKDRKGQKGGCEFEVHRELCFPQNPYIREQDATATVSGQLACPVGFKCEMDDEKFHFTGTDSARLRVRVENLCARRHTIFSLSNAATLSEDTTHECRDAKAAMEIHSSRKACHWR